MVEVSACAPARRCGLAQDSTEEVRLSQNEGIELKDRNPLPHERSKTPTKATPITLVP